MTQQDIENSISASFDSLELCNTILSNSLGDLISGSFNTEPYLFPIASSEDEVRYILNKNREALEWILIEEWFENNVDDSKITEYETVISASKSFNSLI
jgi:gamma-glutamyl-gamma-aminobutyrate hydrolase PuuD